MTLVSSVSLWYIQTGQTLLLSLKFCNCEVFSCFLVGEVHFSSPRLFSIFPWLKYFTLSYHPLKIKKYFWTKCDSSQRIFYVT